MSTSTMKWTERDVQCAAQVLSQATSEGTVLTTLTDEEVVALDGVQHEQVAATPWLSSQDTAQRDLLAAVALRGLLAKELVYPVIFEGETEPSRLHAIEEITGSLTLRRSGDAIVSVERTVSSGKRWLYAYVHVEGVLLEEVDEGGLHGFTVVSREKAAARLAEFVDPEHAAARDTEPATYTEPAFEEHAASALADTRAASNVVAFSTASDDFPTVTIYTGPSGVHLLTPRVENDAVSLELQEASSATLESVFNGLAKIS